MKTEYQSGDSRRTPNSPTSVRYGVLALTTSMAVLLYLDRVCISVAGDDISRDLGLSKREMSFVFSAFFLAYGLAQVPAGWLGDRLGARKMLVACVLGWSLLTALTGLVGGLITLLLARMLFGLAQAGAYPIAARVNSLWMPFSRRALASGIISLGGRVGGVIAPLATAYLIGVWSDWRPVFWLYALPGLLWASLFWVWFRDRPFDHPGCNLAEVSLIETQPAQTTNPLAEPGAFPWRDACRSSSLWMQCFAQLATNVSWAFLITWLPTYLKDDYGVDREESGRLQSLLLLAGVIGCALGGAATDWLTSRLGLKWGRNLLGMTTKFLAALGPLLALMADNVALAVAALMLSSFAVDLGLGATWAYFQDAGGPYVGTLLGWANMFGNLGAFASPLLLGELGVAFGWSVSLTTCAIFFVVSGLCWLGIDARVPIIRERS